MANNWLTTFKGYYLIPHELLHVWGYRIIGKPCQYNWGDCRVMPLTPRTRNERLFISLLPLTISWGIGFLCHVLWLVSIIFLVPIPIERYLIDGPTWHIVFVLLGSVFIIYGGTAHADLINAYYLLFGEEYTEDGYHQQHGQSDDQKVKGNDPQTTNGHISLILESRAFKKDTFKPRVAGDSQEEKHPYHHVK